MIILGALILLIGGLNFAGVMLTSPEQLAQQQQQMEQALFAGVTPPSYSTGTLRTLSLVMAVAVMIVGVSIVILQGPVRRARTWGVVTAAVIIGGVTVMNGLTVLVAGLAGLQAPQVLPVACIFSLPLVMCVVLLFHLFRIYRIVGAAPGAAGVGYVRPLAFAPPPNYAPAAVTAGPGGAAGLPGFAGTQPPTFAPAAGRYGYAQASDATWAPQSILRPPAPPSGPGASPPDAATGGSEAPPADSPERS